MRAQAATAARSPRSQPPVARRAPHHPPAGMPPRPQPPPTQRTRQSAAPQLSLDPRLLGAYDQHGCHLRHQESPPDDDQSDGRALGVQEAEKPASPASAITTINSANSPARAQIQWRSTRVALRSRKPLQAIKHRRAQLMNTRERQLHLRFRPHGPNHRQTRRVNHVVQQCRLAHSRLTTHHQRPAAARSHILQQVLERVALPLAAQQALRRLRSRISTYLPPAQNSPNTPTAGTWPAQLCCLPHTGAGSPPSRANTASLRRLPSRQARAANPIGPSVRSHRHDPARQAPAFPRRVGAGGIADLTAPVDERSPGAAGPVAPPSLPPPNGAGAAASEDVFVCISNLRMHRHR